MNKIAKIIIFSIGIIFIASLGFKVAPVLATGGGNLHQEIHWMIYGYDRVWYHNRTYKGPSKELTLEQAKQQIGSRKTLIKTDKKVIGLTVYVTSDALEHQPSLIFLGKQNGKLLEYELSGGQ